MLDPDTATMARDLVVGESRLAPSGVLAWMYRG